MICRGVKGVEVGLTIFLRSHPSWVCKTVNSSSNWGTGNGWARGIWEKGRGNVVREVVRSKCSALIAESPEFIKRRILGSPGHGIYGPGQWILEQRLHERAVRRMKGGVPPWEPFSATSLVLLYETAEANRLSAHFHLQTVMLIIQFWHWDSIILISWKAPWEISFYLKMLENVSPIQYFLSCFRYQVLFSFLFYFF